MVEATKHPNAKSFISRAGLHFLLAGVRGNDMGAVLLVEVEYLCVVGPDVVCMCRMGVGVGVLVSLLSSLGRFGFRCARWGGSSVLWVESVF